MHVLVHFYSGCVCVMCFSGFGVIGYGHTVCDFKEKKVVKYRERSNVYEEGRSKCLI